MLAAYEKEGIQEASRAGGAILMRRLGLLLLGTGLLVLCANLLWESRLRPGGPGLTLIGLLMVYWAHVGRISWAVQLMCWGLLLIGWSGALMAAGLYNISWIALPIASMLGGCMLGRRMALALMLTTVAAVLSIYALHQQGHQFSNPAPPQVVAGLLIVATLTASLIGHATARNVRRQLQRLGESRGELERAQSLAQVGSWTMEIDSGKVRWSDEYYRIFGIATGSEVSYADFMAKVHPDDKALIEAGWAAAARGDPSYEVNYRILVGTEVKWLRSITEFAFDPQGRLQTLSGSLQDITAQRLALEQIEFLAYHDPMTGLPNRTLGQDRLLQALNAAEHEGSSLGVLYLDLDNFKHFNDIYGHAMGDRLLKSVAARVASSLRAEDTLCRLSGDEFMVVLLDLDAVEQLQRVCQRILTRIAEPLEVEGIKPLLSFSIGGAIYPEHGHDIGSLMRHADLALYEAKRAGRGTFRIFEPRMNESLRHYLQTCDDLRRAIEREEFELHYQPQIALHNSQAIGVEALLRWNHPQRGLLQPDSFIAVAEESGLIAPIGRWVLQEACRQGAAWHRAGWCQLRMAVNLSAVQFRHGQLGQEVFEALAESGLNPRRLELELTESTLLNNDSMILSTVAGWQEQGIELSIDDFGTGYSSLSYLKRLNADKLKIDRSFIANLHEDEQDRTIVRAIIQIAQSMGIKTIAEGIEDPLVAEQLRAMGCDKVQGYWYSKPLPAGQFEQWFKRYTARAA